MAVGLQDLMKEFATIGASQTAARTEIDKGATALNTATDAQIEATRREADLTGQVQAAIDQIVLKKSGMNKQSAAEFGTNQDAQSYVLSQLGEVQRDNATSLIESARTIAEKQQIGFLDDPLQWITKQFTLPREISAHNAKVAEQEIVADTISKLQTQTLQSVAINNSIEANTSTDIMALNAQRLQQAAEKEVARAQQEAAKTNIHVASVRMATDQQGFQNAVTLNRAQVDLQQLQISRANLTLNQEMHKERLKEIQERHASDELLQQDLNRATQVLGYRNITPQQFKQMSGPLKDTLQFAMADPSIVQGRIAPDPVYAVERANIVNAPLTTEKQRVKNAISDMMIVAQQGRADWSALKPEQKHSEYMKAVEGEINRQLKNIPDQGSMFSAPPLQSLNKIATVAETKLWKDNIAPLAKNPMVPTSSQQIFNLAGQAVFEGKMTLEQAAADVATIYTASVADNWHNRDYGAFSIKVPAQYRTTYNTRLKMPNLFTGDQSVDMASETDVKNKLLMYLNTQRGREAAIPGFGNNPTEIGARF